MPGLDRKGPCGAPSSFSPLCRRWRRCAGGCRGRSATAGLRVRARDAVDVDPVVERGDDDLEPAVAVQVGDRGRRGDADPVPVAALPAEAPVVDLLALRRQHHQPARVSPRAVDAEDQLNTPVPVEVGGHDLRGERLGPAAGVVVAPEPLARRAHGVDGAVGHGATISGRRSPAMLTTVGAGMPLGGYQSPSGRKAGLRLSGGVRTPCAGEPTARRRAARRRAPRTRRRASGRESRAPRSGVR